MGKIIYKVFISSRILFDTFFRGMFVYIVDMEDDIKQRNREILILMMLIDNYRLGGFRMSKDEVWFFNIYMQVRCLFNFFLGVFFINIQFIILKCKFIEKIVYFFLFFVKFVRL